MAQEHREQTQETLDVAESQAVSVLQQQLSNTDPKIANKAANDIVGIRLKQAPGAGGPVLQLNFGDLGKAARRVQDIAAQAEIMEVKTGE